MTAAGGRSRSVTTSPPRRPRSPAPAPTGSRPPTTTSTPSIPTTSPRCCTTRATRCSMAEASMADVPRLLVIMGSGETSPTMVKTHREVFERLGPPPVPAVLLDTPFGFQENAAELSARAVDYFRDSVGSHIDVAGFRSEDEVGSLAHETMLTRLREARFVFAGPGSPSY